MGSNLGPGTWLLVLPVTNAHLESIPNLPTIKKQNLYLLDLFEGNSEFRLWVLIFYT
jgi:hypothetical protein